MSVFNIYSKSGDVRCKIKSLEYSGKFLGESFVTTDVSSPTPISFEIGDYLLYRGDIFTLNTLPTCIKQSSANSYGEAFKYEGLKFESVSYELVNCQFLDVVPADNELHYTALPKFSFYASSVKSLAERLQVNLDRVYKGSSKWVVEVDKNYTENVEKNITIADMNCWDALALVNSQWDLNFSIKGRKIAIANSGIQMPTIFRYGKGNGLVSLQRTADSDQAVITRLRAYGSTRNLPPHYYADKTEGLPNNYAVQNLMLPDFPSKTYDPYIDSKNAAELGIKEGSIFFDGSNDTEEIYPTIEGTGLNHLTAAEQIEDNGRFEEGAEIPSFKVVMPHAFDNFDENWNEVSDNPTISFTSGKCTGREFQIVNVKENGDGSYELELNRSEDSDLKLYFPYKDYQLSENDTFVLLGIRMPDEYVQVASEKLLAAAKEFLAKNDYVRYTYEPKIDNIFVQREYDAIENKEESIYWTIKEGCLMSFEDDDLGITGNVFIDTLSIKEGNAAVPEIEVTLREDRLVGTIQKIQNQIDSLSSGGTTGGTDVATVRSIIKNYGGNLFLSKTNDDIAKGKIKFEKGTEYGSYTHGLIGGSGANVDDKGNAEFENVIIRTSITVPEIRFNKASLVIGTDIQSPCGGVIKSVTKTSPLTGVCELELGADDMFGSIQEGALCWGYFHDLVNSSNNSQADFDDRRGNITYKGFATVYFQISEILDSKATTFSYELREGTTLHPYIGMNFGGRGNSKHEGFQSFTIKTPYYKASYNMVSSWDWSGGSEGIGKYLTKVTGLLEGFEQLAGVDKFDAPFGTIDTQLWLRGNVNTINNDKYFLYISQPSNGILVNGENEVVSFKIRDNYFQDATKNYIISVNGVDLPQSENPTYLVRYSDLTNDIVEFNVVCRYYAEGVRPDIASSFKERKITIDYHLDIYKNALNASDEAEFDIQFNDGSNVQFNDFANIASVEGGDTISARRMIGTELTELGFLTYQIDNGNEVTIGNNEQISVSLNALNIVFRWYYSADHSKVVTARSIPVIRVNSAWMIFHDRTDDDSMPTKPRVGQDIAENGWYQGQRETSLWISQKSSPSLLEGEWGEPVRMRGADGTSVHIKGHVSDSSALPSTGESNDAYITDDDGHMWVWADDGSGWFDAGQFKGDRGSNAYVHIKYSHDGKTFSEQSDPNNPKTIGETPAEWMGVYSDSNAEDSLTFSAYAWKRVEGLSYVTGYSFLRSIATPSTPSGGTFDKPTADGWSDGIPSGDTSVPVWMAKRTFCSDNTKTEAKWSTPRMMADTADFDVCYNTSADRPANPLYHHKEDQGNGWTNKNTEDAIWMATDNLVNGVWQGWNIVKVKGEKGDKGEDAKTYELRIVNTVANTSIGFEDEWQFNDESKIQFNDGTQMGAVSEGDVIHASRWFNNELSDIGSLWVQKDSETPRRIENNADYTVLRGTVKVTFYWCRTASFNDDIIYTKLIPIINSGISIFQSFVFRRSAEKPETPVGGTYTNPIPVGWTDGITEDESSLPVWLSKKLFYSDFRVGEVWSEPIQMSDTSDFDIEFTTADVYTPIPNNYHEADKSQWGWSNESGKNSIWMATSKMINGTWTNWTYSRIKGEDAYQVTILTNTGNMRVEKGGTLTLTAKVYKGGVDITDSLRVTAFTWVRTSQNPDSDVIWNARHTGERGVGNVIEIGDEDIYRQALFDCIVDVDYYND